MTSPPDHAPDRSASHVTEIRGDLPCTECGYNLRGLPITGHCPECATPVERTCRPDLLGFANRTWVRGLRRGLTRVYASMACAITGFTLWVVLMTAASNGAGTLLIMAILGCATPVWLLLCAGLLAGGVFDLTTQEPRVTYIEPPGSWRRRLRLGCLVLVGLILLAVLLPTSPGALKHIVAIVRLTVFALALYVLYGILSELQNLARRVPDLGLMHTTRRYRRTSTASGAVVMAFWILGECSGIVFSPAPGGGPPGPLGTAAVMGMVCATPLIALLVFLGGQRLVYRFRRALATVLARDAAE